MLHTLTRLIVSVAGGTFAAVALLWSMQWLVMREHAEVQTARERPRMEFVRLQRKPEARLKKRELPQEPPPPQDPRPAIPQLPLTAATRPVVRAPDVAFAVPSIPLNMAGPYIGPVRQGPPDRDFMVLSRLPPQYPYRAKRRGIEGWVKVSFEITAEGSVRDVVVIDADPPDVFDHEAIRAVSKWKFKPRIEDGRPVEARVEQLVDFRLRGKGS